MAASLLDPIRIGSKTAPSRALFGPHCTNFATANLPNARHAAYYGRRAAGGAGLIVLEHSSVHPSDWPYEKALLGYDERIVDGYRLVAEAVRPHGALALAGLNHNGMQAGGQVRKQAVLAASAVPNPATMEMPKVMEAADIAAVVDGYGRAARLAVAGGLDGVEINAGQYSLLRQFLSGLTNLRTDDWGGSLENRLRLARQVIRSVRAALGPGPLVGLRLSCDEYAPWAGLTPADGVEVARRLGEDGGLDYLLVTTGSIYTIHMTAPAMHTPPGHHLELAAAVKAALPGLPVLAGDGGLDAAGAEAALNTASLDGLDMTRAFIADPDLVLKLRQGRPAAVRPCIRCNQDCVVRSPLNQIVSCIHNPAAGHEQELGPLGRAAVSRRVLVVGAGPAGLECARVAAERGHQVAVYERAAEPGGSVRLAALAPTRAEMRLVIEWRLAELARLGVALELGVEVTPALVERLDPHVVVVATGGRPRPADIPGGDLPHVIGPRQALAGEAPGVGRVVVVDFEGYQAAINAAEFLAARGRPVELLTEDNFVSMQLGALQELTPWYGRAAAAGIQLSPMTVVVRIEPDRVMARHRYGPPDQQRVIEGVDAVVMVNYDLAEDGLYLALQTSGRTVLRAGDAVAPRRVTQAVLEGQRLARLI